MANGNLELNLQPEMVMFLGFRDLDNANKTLSPTQEQMQAGHRFEPVFSTREIRTVIQTKSEETVVLGGFVKETNQKETGLIGAGKESQSLFVFVTAKLLKPIVAEEPVTMGDSGWAPFVIKTGEEYSIIGSHLGRASSLDLENWTDQGKLNAKGLGRDPHVRFWNDTYHLYRCANGDGVSLVTSRDFTTWSNRLQVRDQFAANGIAIGNSLRRYVLPLLVSLG